MSACLIMLTNTYPFNGGEYFIENEIEIVSRSFDKVIICALDANSTDVITRKIPENAVAFITGSHSRKRERMGDLVKGIISLPFEEAESKTDKTKTEKNLKRKIFCKYFLQRAYRQYRQVMSKLSVRELKEYDKVVIYSYWFYAAAIAGIEIKKNLLNNGVKSVKIISRAHGYDVYEERNPLNYLPEREYLLENLDMVFTCSRDAEDYLKRKYPSFSGKIEYSPLGTKDRGKVTPGKGNSFIIVTCSSLNPVKRVWRVADAISLYTGAKKIKWIHIGGQGSKLEKLKKYAYEKLSGKNVSCEFKGQMSNENVNEFYLDISPDLFLNVSESEGVPVSVMEAASFGIPVIATDCGGTAEAVEDKVTGILIEKDFTDEKLLREIERIIAMDEREKKLMSAAGRSMWKKKYDAERNYSEFAKKLLSEG